MVYETRDHDWGNRPFSLPIVVKSTFEPPQILADEYYALIIWKDGTVKIADKGGCHIFPVPGVLCIAPGHSIAASEFIVPYNNSEASPIYSVIFRPDGINRSFTNFPPTFEYETLNNIPMGCQYHMLSSTFLDTLLQLCQNIDKELNEVQSSFWGCLTRSYILEILVLLARSSYQNRSHVQFTLPDGDEKTQQIFQYIHTEYYRKITLESLSRQFGTNRTTLNNLFKDRCGISIMSYVAKVRIEIASLLLRNTLLSVSDIALRTGFDDEAYFSRAFHKKTGTTPREYRAAFPDPYRPPVNS